MYQRVSECYRQVRNLTPFKPKIALVLGSGLGALADEIQVDCRIHYSQIKGFPVSTVPGHHGILFFGYIEDVPVVIMQGRIHYYEGYSMEDVVLPIRLMRLLGAEVLFLTNAAGGIDTGFAPGDFMLIRDQIASFVPSPLIGKNPDELGARLPDMSVIYNKNLRETISQTAQEMDIELKEGVYVQLSGPNFETPAEINMCRIIGGHAVGMSTACEAIAARHAGMKVCGISCISNLASGISSQLLSHEEVQETADRVAPLFKQLITRSIQRIAEVM
ncbi:MAG: purine-nucleoside phosphorylase [Clostridiales bacterium]|nr:purine-nucleoside phosphorylase [Clostridiales bacterium]